MPSEENPMNDDVLDRLEGYDDSEELDEPGGLVEVPLEDEQGDESSDELETPSGHPLDGLTSEQKDAVLAAFAQGAPRGGAEPGFGIEDQLAGLVDLQYTNP